MIDNLRKAEIKDFYLKSLHSTWDRFIPTNFTAEYLNNEYPVEENISVDETERLLSEMSDSGQIYKLPIMDIFEVRRYIFTIAGNEFIESKKSYVAEYKTEIKRKRSEEFHASVEKYKKFFEIGGIVLSVLLSVISIILSVGQGNVMDEVKAENKQLIHRIEKLEKADQQKAIETKIQPLLRK